MKNFAKLFFGFVVGTVGYVVGFIVCGTVMELLNLITIVPKTIDLEGAGATASAFGANVAALWLFERIDKNDSHFIAFSIWLIVLAVLYLVYCLMVDIYGMIWFSVLSVILNGVSIKMAIDKIAKKGKE